MKLLVRVDQKMLETFGTRSLVGKVNDHLQDLQALPNELVLEFPQTSLGWRQQHGGPDQVIMNEYVLPCFIEDILWMAEHGVKVSVSTPVRE